MERVQKLISKAGAASRRKAEELIKQGKVLINSKTATLGDKATFNDTIIVDGIVLNKQEEFVYFLLNKPRKTISSTSDPRQRETVVDLIHTKQRIFPIGRLDYDTTGLLLLTNDGALAHRLMHPSYEIERVYEATLTGELSLDELKKINGPDMIINDKKSKQSVSKIGTKKYKVILWEGSYHHVKKLFGYFNKKVIDLKRVSFANITLPLQLKPGDNKRLNVKQVRQLKQLVKLI